MSTHQHCEVRLRRPTDHVGHKALMSRRVQDGEVLLLCLKVRPAYLHRLPLVPLLLVGVQSPGQVPIGQGTQKKAKSSALNLGFPSQCKWHEPFSGYEHFNNKTLCRQKKQAELLTTLLTVTNGIYQATIPSRQHREGVTLPLVTNMLDRCAPE